MARLRQNFMEGTVDNSPLLIGGTTLNSTELASLMAVAGPDILAMTLDPGAVNGAPEIVHVTAHTALATSATILRGQEGTAARAHPAGTEWEHNINVEDFDYDNLDNLPALGVAIEDEGTPDAQALTLNFIGDGVSAVVTGDVADITIPGASTDFFPITLMPSLWLPADEGLIGSAAAATTGNWLDFSGQDNDATVNGNPTYQTAIVNGLPVARLDGTGDFYSISTTALNFERNNPFTIAWVGNLSTTTVAMIAKQDNGGVGRGWDVLSLGDTLTLSLVSTGGANELIVSGSTNITALGFFLGVVIYDGTSAPAGVALRVNGAAETPSTVANTLSATIVNAISLNVGARGAGGIPMTGDIAEVMVFNRALSTTDRDALEDYLMTKYGL